MVKYLEKGTPEERAKAASVRALLDGVRVERAEAAETDDEGPGPSSDRKRETNPPPAPEPQRYNADGLYVGPDGPGSDAPPPPDEPSGETGESDVEPEAPAPTGREAFEAAVAGSNRLWREAGGLGPASADLAQQWANLSPHPERDDIVSAHARLVAEAQNHVTRLALIGSALAGIGQQVTDSAAAEMAVRRADAAMAILAKEARKKGGAS
jgi:hypothetical protein